MSTFKPGRLSDQVGARVRNALDVRDLTAEEVAARCPSMSPARVQNRLDGLAPWSLDELGALAYALQVPVEDFVRESQAV